jgi:hypothetical protein
MEKIERENDTSSPERKDGERESDSGVRGLCLGTWFPCDVIEKIEPESKGGDGPVVKEFLLSIRLLDPTGLSFTVPSLQVFYPNQSLSLYGDRVTAALTLRKNCLSFNR